MDRDSIKWLIAGLAGAVFTVALFVGCGIGLFLYLQKLNPDGQTSWLGEDSGEDEEPIRTGPEQWKEKESKFNEAKAESELYCRTHGLDTMYETVSFHDNTRDVLYKEQNFDLVNERLAAHLSEATTPMEKHRYHMLIADLGEINYNYEPEALLATLNAWVAHSPNSYLPLLVRGSFYIDYGWYYRGENYSDKIDPKDWAKYEQYHVLAWSDLTRAEALNATDPEIPATMMRAVTGRPGNQSNAETLAELRTYYDKTLALNPHHLGVRSTLLNFSQPKWFGSWSIMDDVLAEVEEAEAGFPLLGIVKSSAVGMMYDRSPTHQRRWDTGKADQILAEAYRAQAEQTPDELMVLGNAAYYAIEAGDRASALDFFRRIGNRFPRGSKYQHLYSYHWSRVNTLVEFSAEDDVRGTPQEKALLDEALALDPSNNSVSSLYLAYLERTRDDTQTKAFLQTTQDPYLQGQLDAEPLNYHVIKGVALAGRSDEDGYQGTDDEKKLLDEALALAPESAFVRLVYAEYFTTNKDYDQARLHLERARELDPDYLPALHIMGWLNYHQKRWDEAIACANQFLATGPSLYLTWNTDDAKDIIATTEKKKAKAAAS